MLDYGSLLVVRLVETRGLLVLQTPKMQILGRRPATPCGAAGDDAYGSARHSAMVPP